MLSSEEQNAADHDGRMTVGADAGLDVEDLQRICVNKAVRKRTGNGSSCMEIDVTNATVVWDRDWRIWENESRRCKASEDFDSVNVLRFVLSVAGLEGSCNGCMTFK